MKVSFEANIIFRGKIECLTGLHIGGSKDKLEIGGVDSPIIRDPRTRQPYLPGSSIKGRMRALLEYSLDAIDPQGGPSQDEKILRIFGQSAGEEEAETAKFPGPTPLIVRDCYADAETVKKWQNLDSELLFTEYKSENTINRITSAANPRFLERVIAGSCFDFEMVYTVMKDDSGDLLANVNRNLQNLALALRLLEANSLGKSGSRGYGKVAFHLAKPVVVTNEDYANCTDAYKASKRVPSLSEMTPLTDFDAPEYPNKAS